MNNFPDLESGLHLLSRSHDFQFDLLPIPWWNPTSSYLMRAQDRGSSVQDQQVVWANAEQPALNSRSDIPSTSNEQNGNIVGESIGDREERKKEPKEEKREMRKRSRTIFTKEQLEQLEARFQRQQYMVGAERVRLAKYLNLSETQIKVWFQNRRIKWRRQMMIGTNRPPGNSADKLTHKESQ